MVLEEARSEPRSRKQPQNNAGGARRSQEATCGTQMAQITMSSVRVWVENRERATTNSASGDHKKKRGNDRLPNAARSRKKDDGRWTTILRGLSSSDDPQSRRRRREQASVCQKLRWPKRAKPTAGKTRTEPTAGKRRTRRLVRTRRLSVRST